MRYAIIPVAGLSTRFHRGGEKVLKCIYHRGEEKNTLLYSILSKCRGLDRVIVVGGYRYEELCRYLERFRDDFPTPVTAVFNEHYEDYGTGYSLWTGMQTCLADPECSQILLAEGDLFFDCASFRRIVVSDKSCAAWNRNFISSDKAVVGYIDVSGRIKYAFNRSHGPLTIPEPCLGLFHSGQVWKFSDGNLIRKTVDKMVGDDWTETNLVFIQKYFSEIPVDQVELVELKQWENCNTRQDYGHIERLLQTSEVDR